MSHGCVEPAGICSCKPRKSQIAIEYTYRLRETDPSQRPETWVFWVYANSATRFKQNYCDIALSVKLQTSGYPEAEAIDCVFG